MSHRTPRYQSGVMGPHHSMRRGVQQNPQGRFPPAHPEGWFPPADPNALHREIQQLSSLLEMERVRRFEDDHKLAHLEAELEETKIQLKRQKALKELYINKSKETREVKRVEKFIDPEVLNTAVIASKVHNTGKYKKKKVLQQNFEELKVVHLLSQEAFESEILAEREKSKALQEELDELQTSFEELRSKYEADVALVRQEAETHKFCEARLSEEQRLLKNLRARQYDVFQEMSRKIAVLQESEKLLLKELNWIKFLYNELIWKYESDVSGLKQDMETYRQEVSQEREANLERANENLQLIINLRAEKEELFQKTSRHITILQKREKFMQNELDQVHVSHKQLKSRYETEIMELQQQAKTYQQKIKEQTALSNRKKKDEELIRKRNHSVLQQQVEDLQLQINQERKAHLQKTKENMALLDDIRATDAVLHENITNVIEFLQEKEKDAQAELENVKGLYQELSCRYETDVTALKQQAEDYQQEISRVKDELERTKDLLLPETLRTEKEDQKLITVFQEKEEEDSQSQADPVKVLSREVSSEKELSGETLSGCSKDPESMEAIEIPAEAILEDLGNPFTQTMQDGKKKTSKFSFWKKVRNTLRLKKPKRKKSEDSQEQV
ncbi:interaptin-like [Poecilia formosa]|uniref:interaptin-like n=1 Tax=Poecilia formosa TaxID=48698 RepID=UPI0007B9E157|nr:PREDICTED: interaptin-like [Poecilia formosa]